MSSTKTTGNKTMLCQYSLVRFSIMIACLAGSKNIRDINLRCILVESIASASKTVVVCVAGFEGLSSAVPKFINLTKELLLSAATPIAVVFRYDSTDIGLSEGKYYKMTIATLVDDLTHATDLGSCVITQFLNSTGNYFHIEKIILLAPALNQYDLHRYCNPIDVCKSYRAHKVLYAFTRLCSQEDFSFKLNDYENHNLHIHGNQDSVVPIESIKRPFKNILI
ncbi:unnamed protein product [Rotaria magnacalcarata]|uniref:Uncharacterized protein n=2 Tax=Rotaria magnacalcarata TaxID=392030 RepID=A0A816WYS2_9BILA|nr:unnamed protein product [Rotaria magnacalcarata]